MPAHSCPGFIRIKPFFRTRIRTDSREKIFRLPGHMMHHMKKRSAIQTDPSDEPADRRIVIITFRQKMSDGMVVIQRILPTVRIPASNYPPALQTPPQGVFHHFSPFHRTERTGKTLNRSPPFPFRFFHAVTSERFFLTGLSAPLLGLIFLFHTTAELSFRIFQALEQIRMDCLLFSNSTFQSRHLIFKNRYFPFAMTAAVQLNLASGSYLPQMTALFLKSTSIISFFY